MAYSTVSDRATLLNVLGVPETATTCVPSFSGPQAAPDVDVVSAHVVNTPHVRLELVRCRSQSVVPWRASGPGMYLMLVRPWTEELRITFSGAPSEHIGCGR